MKIKKILSLILTFFSLPLFANQEQIGEKRIVVLMCSYNNGPTVHKALASVLMQKYSNWKAYFFDDASNTNDAEHAQSFLQRYDHNHQFTIVRNTENCGALANHLQAIYNEEIRNDDILIFVDGDDFLVHDAVFNRVNEEYHKGAAVTFGQYIQLPSQQLGHSRAIPPSIIATNKWRDIKLPLATSHLRTCYAGLARQIPLHDLLYQGKLYKVCPDIALFWPVLEQAGMRAHFIPDILYAYQETDINDYKIRLPLVLTCYQDLRTHKRYQPLSDNDLEKILTPHDENTKTADMIIFSYNRPLQLYAFLESLQKYCQGLKQLSVIYRVTTQEYAEAYTEVKTTFSNVNFMQQSENPHADFKPLVIESFEQGSSDYIIFAVDDIIVKDDINVSECIEALEKTHAYGFYLRLGTNLNYCFNLKCTQPVPPLTKIQGSIVAWQFNCSNGDWAYPNTVDMTIYKKDTVRPALYALTYKNPSDLEGSWYIPEYVDMHNVGLCYSTSKIINIPLNVVQSDRPNPHMNVATSYLLDLFKKGLKIDLAPLHQLNNTSAHCEVKLSWCTR